MIWLILVRTYHDLKHKAHRPSIWIPTHLKSELQKVLSSNFSGIQTVRIKFLFYFNSLYKLNLLFSAFDFAKSPNTKVQIYNDFNLCQYSGDMNTRLYDIRSLDPHCIEYFCKYFGYYDRQSLVKITLNNFTPYLISTSHFPPITSVECVIDDLLCVIRIINFFTKL